LRTHPPDPDDALDDPSSVNVVAPVTVIVHTPSAVGSLHPSISTQSPVPYPCAALVCTVIGAPAVVDAISIGL
jgi:hypothetical protein